MKYLFNAVGGFGIGYSTQVFGLTAEQMLVILGFASLIMVGGMVVGYDMGKG